MTNNIQIDKDLLSACIHCGMCLPACPTYLVSGKEMESPRGRIHLLNLLNKGELTAEPRLVEHIDSCLGCLGCETACPSGVDYSKILDQARPLLAQKRSPFVRQMMRLSFQYLLPDYKRLRVAGWLMRAWQSTQLDQLPKKLPWLKALMGRAYEWQEFLPRVPKFEPLPTQSWISGEKKEQVQLFGGCVMDIFYNHVNHAAIRLLTAQRHIVKVPEQTCCGALAFHAGEMDIAKELAKRNIEYFESQPGDIVVTAAGCGAVLKQYGELLADDPQWKESAHDFSARVKDITEALSEGEFVNESKPLGKKVAYHAACHLSHAQGVRKAPVDLLRRIKGIELIPLLDAEQCCGSAGTYNITHTRTSMEILDRKMNNIKDTGADIVVTTNPGCLLQLEKGIKDQGVNMQACHIVELLDQSFVPAPDDEA